MTKVLIVEDETAAAINLTALLAEQCTDLEIVAQLESVTDTVAWIKSNPAPDLVFMDIHLADGDAFMIFEQVEFDAPIIFTTAYDQYALDAFKFNSVDYILKPIKSSDVQRAMDKWGRFSGLEKTRYVERIADMAHTHNNVKSSFLIHVKDKLVPLKPNDIAFCHTSGERVVAHTLDGRELPMDNSLDTIMGTLDTDHFFRANRQFIVSRAAVRDISIWFGSRLKLNLCVPLPEQIIISKARVPEFKRWLTSV